jgi:hypothetical protein
MGYHVQVGNTTRVDIARADSILNLVSTLNPAVKSELSIFIAEFYTMWANNIPGLLNFHDEAVKVGRTFRKLLTKYPDDAGELADAFCLAIRQELTNIEDYATERPLATGPVPDAPVEVAVWFQAIEQARVAAVVELLWGSLPALSVPEGSNPSCSRTLFFRHKLTATITLYQYARDCYEKHTPKSFARRPDLPSYYAAPPTSIVTSQPNAKQYHSVTTDPAKNDKAQKLIGLFSFGVQPNEVADLITLTLFAPGSDEPLGLSSLRAYAIAYALKLHRVIKWPNKKFAALIGEVWGVPVGIRRNDQGPVWHELYESLRDDVLRIKTNAQARERKP